MTETSRQVGQLHERAGRRSAAGGGHPFRPDIEGLRAVAVTAVVLYHAGVHSLSGGFVGVDVFYVISGFLITDLLWRELSGRRRLSLARFYARRARRLLPAAMLVLVVTLAGAALWMPPLAVRSVWVDGLYCALYIGNFHFAATSTNYLASHSPSPFLHFWSLGVEEQFYAIWPLLLLAASLVWWRRRPSRTAVAAVLAVICGASLGLSVWLTRADQPLAFFLLPDRAWELGLGGLLALAVPVIGRVPQRLAAMIGWGGLAAIAVACVAYGSQTPYPGSAAILPVAGAGAVVAAGTTATRTGPVLLLGRRGPRAVGRISYSWYLWHYPVLILAPYALGHRLGLWPNLGLAGLSAVAAVITFRFVENPVRASRRLAGHPRRSLLTGAALSVSGVVACFGTAWSIPSVTGHGRAPVASISQSSAPAGGRAATSPSGRAMSALAAAQSQVEAAVAASAGNPAVPANLNPPLSAAAASEAAPMVDGCLQSYTSTAVPTCLFGDTTAARSIVLFGDSHAAMWFPAVDAYATLNGFRLYVWTKAACPPVAIALFSPDLGRTWTECSGWYSNAMAAISSARPALVVMGIAPNYDAAYHVAQDGPAWLAGLRSTVSALQADGAKVLVMGSIPSPDQNVPDCLSAHLDSVGACEFPPVDQHVSGGGLLGVDRSGQAAEATTATAAGATYADVIPWFCTPTVCDVVVDDLLVYRDDSHITVPYASYLAPLVGDEMTAALDAPA